MWTTSWEACGSEKLLAAAWEFEVDVGGVINLFQHREFEHLVVFLRNRLARFNTH